MDFTAIIRRSIWKAILERHFDWETDRKIQKQNEQLNAVALELDIGFSAWFDFNSVDISLSCLSKYLSPSLSSRSLARIERRLLTIWSGYSSLCRTMSIFIHFVLSIVHINYLW